MNNTWSICVGLVTGLIGEMIRNGLFFGEGAFVMSQYALWLVDDDYVIIFVYHGYIKCVDGFVVWDVKRYLSIEAEFFFGRCNDATVYADKALFDVLLPYTTRVLRLACR